MGSHPRFCLVEAGVDDEGNGRATLIVHWTRPPGSSASRLAHTVDCEFLGKHPRDFKHEDHILASWARQICQVLSLRDALMIDL